MKEGKEINNEHDGYYLLPHNMDYKYKLQAGGGNSPTKLFALKD